MADPNTRPDNLTAEEWEMVLQFRRAKADAAARARGLDAAARLADEWADQCGGGSGAGGDGYRNLAAAIRQL